MTISGHRLTKSKSAAATVVRLGVDTKLFDALASVGEEGASIEELATKTDAEPLLVCKVKSI